MSGPEKEPTRNRTPPRWLTLALHTAAFLVVAALFFWELKAVGNPRVDDAYITFSYSRNLATGAGLVYSHGLRVEGYSNFLWMLLLSIPLSIKPDADPYLFARVLTVPFGVVFLGATYWLMRRASRGLAGSAVLAWIGLAWIVVDTDVIVGAVTGLETLPYAALVVLAFALYVAARDGNAIARGLLFPCLLAVALMRIDGFVPFAFVLSWEVAAEIRAKRFRLQALARWAGPSLLVYLLWFGWRWSYYGLFLPTTYYAKALIPIALPTRGWEYTRDFWNGTGLFAIAPIALFGAIRERTLGLLLLAFVFVQTAYVIRVGGDWMPFNRFFLVVVPLVWVLVVAGAARALHDVSTWNRAGAAAFGLFLLMATLWSARRADCHSIDSQAEKDKLLYMFGMAPTLDNNFLPAARLLDKVVPPGKKLASDYAGVMSYFTHAEVIDMWGLANQEIALRGTTEGINPVWGRTCPRCYADIRPDYFHVPTVGKIDGYGQRGAVVAAVFQSKAIGRYLNFKDYVGGRARERTTGRTLYFLERKTKGADYTAFEAGDDIVVEYPFPPQESTLP